jgi:hypothetical protein
MMCGHTTDQQDYVGFQVGMPCHYSENFMRL